MSGKNIIAIIGLFLATILVIVAASFLLSKPASTPTSLVDQDTGEVYDITINNVETGGGAFTSEVHIFGIEPFLQTLASKNYGNSDFASAVKNALYQYSSDRLNDTFTSITLRPQNLVIEKSVIRGEIRLGETDEILPIIITPSETKATAVIVINKNNSSHDGTFVYVGGLSPEFQADNLQSTVSQVDDHSSDLLISTYSNRESGLQYLEQLGYNIPDFSIRFDNNYENPFL